MMMYTDSSRGLNFAKDPAVVRFHDEYFMYYTLSPGKIEPAVWGIGIAGERRG